MSTWSAICDMQWYENLLNCCVFLGMSDDMRLIIELY